MRLGLARPGHQLQGGLHKTGNPSGVAAAGGGTRPELTGSRDDVWEDQPESVGMESAAKQELCQGLAGRARAGRPAGRGPAGGSRTQEVFKGNTPFPKGSGHRAV